jgi:two-component system OmpR family response regulator
MPRTRPDTGPMFEPTALIAEDDDELRLLVVAGLREAGFAADGVATGSAFLTLLERRRADVLILDVGLPDADGRDVCQALRARGIRTPVLFLTARDAVPDRISGFTAGGDDYVTKPFSLAEVAVRLRALVRRSGDDTGTLVAGPLALDPVRHTVTVGARTRSLTPTEMRLLGALAARAGTVLRRRELVAAAWPHGSRVSENTLDAYVARLRRKLRELPGAPAIQTSHGVGYTLR